MANIFSGIKPSGDLTLGNYIGAITNFVKLQDEHNCYFCVVDLHAITVPQDRADLKKRTKDIAALYLACGIDPKKATVFIQSEVPAHTQLGWLLECNTYIGELNRMTQFKDKAQKNGTDGLTSGLYTYPVLMAADILLYDSNLVPVGDDQKQHVEIARDIAVRFNNKYGETFILPETYAHKVGARIMDLQDPTKKMSKSDNDKGCILLLDDPKIIHKKIMSAITDSESIVKFDKENKPGISNLLTIYSKITNLTIEELEGKFVNANYGEFKKALADELVTFITPIQNRFNEIRNSKELDDILDEGAMIANQYANRKVQKVMKKIGLIRK
ncbi:MAG: tryptophan--tRNA ligase [Haloplasmataceae bacterium]|jgi:tryptophanyl-tRNA synthetase|nr:tryptophan--tRNA ligase [Haloplasmataceae bacterium]